VTPSATRSVRPAAAADLPKTGQSGGVLITSVTGGVIAVAVGVALVIWSRRPAAAVASTASTTAVLPVTPED